MEKVIYLPESIVFSLASFGDPKELNESAGEQHLSLLATLLSLFG